MTLKLFIDTWRQTLSKAIKGEWSTYFATGEGVQLITCKTHKSGQKQYDQHIMPLFPKKDSDWDNYEAIVQSVNNAEKSMKIIETLTERMDNVRSELSSINPDLEWCIDEINMAFDKIKVELKEEGNEIK